MSSWAAGRAARPEPLIDLLAVGCCMPGLARECALDSADASAWWRQPIGGDVATTRSASSATRRLRPDLRGDPGAHRASPTWPPEVAQLRTFAMVGTSCMDVVLDPTRGSSSTVSHSPHAMRAGCRPTFDAR